MNDPPLAQLEREACRDDVIMLEPNRIQLSQAISLKRIADALDRLEPAKGSRWPNLLTPEEIARQGE